MPHLPFQATSREETLIFRCQRQALELRNAESHHKLAMERASAQARAECDSEVGLARQRADAALAKEREVHRLGEVARQEELARVASSCEARVEQEVARAVHTSR